MKPEDGYVRVTFEMFYVGSDGGVRRNVQFHSTLRQDADLGELKESCIDGIRALGYTFADGDFL